MEHFNKIYKKILLLIMFISIVCIVYCTCMYSQTKDISYQFELIYAWLVFVYADIKGDIIDISNKLKGDN